MNNIQRNIDKTAGMRMIMNKKSDLRFKRDYSDNRESPKIKSQLDFSLIPV